MPRNLELKAHYPSATALRIATTLPARNHGRFRQTDTYFRIDGGRLKLRQTRAGKAEVIFYKRPDRRDARMSRYVIIRVNNVRFVKSLLHGLFGTSVIVRKTRRVFLYRNARIHVDRVQGIGTFVEFEVVIDRGLRQAQRLMSMLRDAFRIPHSALVSSSYSDLVQRRERN